MQLPMEFLPIQKAYGRKFICIISNVMYATTSDEQYKVHYAAVHQKKIEEKNTKWYAARHFQPT